MRCVAECEIKMSPFQCIGVGSRLLQKVVLWNQSRIPKPWPHPESTIHNLFGMLKADLMSPQWLIIANT